MPRNITGPQIAAICSSTVRLALLASLEFASSTEYVWSGRGSYVWNGHTFKGLGKWGGVDGISEDSDVEAKGVVLSLSGIPLDLAGEVLNDVRVLGDCNIWMALFDAAGARIGEPILIYRGKMDAPQLEDDLTTCTASINVENVLVDLNRAVYRRYTDEDQQLDLADTLAALGLPSNTVDTGFTHVAGLQEQITFWGMAPSSVNNV
jgi:hypothetical protein